MPRPLAVVSLVMLALRIVWVLSFREIDSDAYGHFIIAIATRKDPTNLSVHWVWLPLYHFIVAALSASLKLSFRGLRLANALLATLGPILLHRALRGRAADSIARPWAEDPALLAALALALAPLTTILGQSAQPETLFSVLLVATTTRRSAVCAGIFLALACLVRYEAWGGALALLVGWAALRARGSSGGTRGPPFELVAIPALVIASYVALRWWSDGRLLLFFRGTRDITTRQVGRLAWTFDDVISFPVVLPYVVLGPVLAFVPLGARAVFGAPRDWLLPVGLAGFLVLSFYSGASHAGDRYLVSLMPFACATIGAGVVRVGLKLRRPRTVAVIACVLLSITTARHLRNAASMAIAWDDGLRAREAELARLAD
jgi:hypothetical protein